MKINILKHCTILVLIFCNILPLFAQRNKACDMLIVIDNYLYVNYGSDVDTIINIVDEHIDGLNYIYEKTVFKNQYSQYYFYAKNVEIMQDFCDYCNETHDEFLKEFSKYDTSGYCLAVLFTHRDFPGGIQGLGLF